MKPRDKVKNKSSNNRRKSIYLKRLGENDEVFNISFNNSPVSRRTRRQSMANLKSMNKKPLTNESISAEEVVSKSKVTKNLAGKKDSTTELPSRNHHFVKNSNRTNGLKVICRPMTVSSSQITSRDTLSNIPKKNNTKNSKHIQEKKPVVRKVLKRLETASTPLNRGKNKNSQSTRYSTRTNSKSNAYSDDKVFQKSSMKKLKGLKINKSPKLVETKNKKFLFTPKLEDPSTILKQQIKRKVTSEMNSIPTDYSPSKSWKKSVRKKDSIHKDISSSNFHLTNGNDSTHYSESHFPPTTPLSSRKASNRIRNSSVRHRSSTPVKSSPFPCSRLNFEKSDGGENTSLHELSSLYNHQTTDSSFNDSFTKSMSELDQTSSINSTDDGSEQPKSSEQQRGYCVLM